MSDNQDEVMYTVVLNLEEQYSIWPAARDLPPGWQSAGKSGTKSECLAHIENIWTDMRPLGLRRRMEANEIQAGTVLTAPELEATSVQDDLVTYLSSGDHPIEATASSVTQFLQRMEAGHVTLKFTGTRGGTEVGVKLNSSPSPVASVSTAGRVHLEGELKLNYRKVRLVADLALDNLKGSGHLEPADFLQ